MKPIERGRFAPSPTGPLHFGSLVAAVGSWLFARRAGGEWLVRIEDLDRARVIPGSESEILRALERYGLHWDGVVTRQSERIELYEEALDRLRRDHRAYDCCCSRAEVARAASAPAPGEAAGGQAVVYPGTCRSGIPPGRKPRAVRFLVSSGTFGLVDVIAGPISQNVAEEVGDFVIRRADGPFAYQLAVVVDDADQRITQVVRGADLLDSTPRQIAIQHALELPTPLYAHLPLIVNLDGAKLAKRDGALPLEQLDASFVRSTLMSALRALGVEVGLDDPSTMLSHAVSVFDPARVPMGPLVTV